MSDEAALGGLPLPDLKEKLKSKGLSIAGNREALVGRLLGKEQVPAAAAGAAPKAAGAAPAAKAQGAPNLGQAAKAPGKGKGKGKDKGKGKLMAKGKGKGKVPGKDDLIRMMGKALGKGKPAPGQAYGFYPGAKGVILGKGTGRGLRGALPKAGGAPVRRLWAGALAKAAPWSGMLPKAAGMLLKGKGKGKGKRGTMPKAMARPPKKAGDGEDDPDYDPFSEQPSEAVKASNNKLKRKGALPKSAAGGLRPKRGAQAKGRALPPWRQQQAQVEFTEADRVKMWLARGPSRRMLTAAAKAQEYFQHSDAATPAKKAKLAPTVSFAPELLSKAPEALQTCRSLLMFLDKKLAEISTPPEVTGPKDLVAPLTEHAASVGWLKGLKSASGWDARAKRVLDIKAIMATAEGEAAWQAAEKKAKETGDDLELQLKERGMGTVEEATKERVAWEEENSKRSWLIWCSKLLRAKEAALLADGDAKEAAPKPGAKVLGPVGVLEAILAGKGAA